MFKSSSSLFGQKKLRVALKVGNQIEYQPLNTTDECTLSAEFEGDEVRELIIEKEPKPSRRSRPSALAIVLTVLNLCVFLVSTACFTVWYRHEYTLLNANLRRASSYSPAFDMIDLELSNKKINGSFYRPKDGGSIARQQPNPEADALWDEWELTRVFPITKSDIIRLGKDPSTATKLEDEVWHLGDDAYAAIFDVYHQVHCLNSLRQVVYGDYYNKSMGRVDTVKQREIHLNHCIDQLLQTIQCSGNMNLITLHWIETQEYPFPDMSINKQCVNFDKFTDWRKANTIDMDKYVEVMKKPEGYKPGVKQLPASDQYYEYWGYDNPNHKPKPEGHGIPMDIDSIL